jgi:hypothetical protein
VKQQPELVSAAGDATVDAFPAYNYHGDVLNEHWGPLTEKYAAFQFALLEGDEIVARCCSLPVPWDGTLEDLPEGMDDSILRAVGRRQPTALMALLIAIPRAHRGRHVSTDGLLAMIEIARRHGLHSLIAPVRPTLKERYPLTPIERYAEWRLDDGRAFDPWIRIHERVGGRILRAAPRSVQISGTVAEWEEWVGLEFPESGEYWFPHGLAPLGVDRDADRAEYWEPNVWMVHEVQP